MSAPLVDVRGEVLHVDVSIGVGGLAKRDDALDETDDRGNEGPAEQDGDDACARLTCVEVMYAEPPRNMPRRA